MSDEHRYAATVSWVGSTADGYDHYGRTHRLDVAAAAFSVAVSADPAYRGDPSRLNPEQLLLASAASCQLLSFLAVASRARIEVIAYEDRGEASMPHRDGPMAVETIVLRPTITVRDGPSEHKVRRLVDVAHRECFIANSLVNPPIVEPSINFVHGT